MPPRLARCRRSLRTVGLAFAVLPWSSTMLLDAQELPLERDYPGAGRYQCPALAPLASLPEEADLRRAARLASDANQAMALGDFERSQELLSQAAELDPTRAEYAYQHGRALEDLGDADNALLEYCRALALDIEARGVLDTRDRIDALYEEVRERIPAEAREAFVQGLAEADSAAFEAAVGSFTQAIDAAPEWGAPVYNRGVIYERLGETVRSLADYRRYIELAPTDVDPILVLVSERIGELEGAASVATPSPGGAFALGLLPGMGQYYTGRPGLGTLTLAAAVGAIAAGAMPRRITTLCAVDVPADGTCPSDLVFRETTERPYLWYGIGAAAVITVVSAVDAFRSAKARRDATEAITDPTGDDDTVSLEPTVTSDGAKVDVNLLRIRFR